MPKYRVTFEVTVNEGHPRKWVPDALTECLQPGEDIDNYVFEEIVEETSTQTE